MKHRGDLLTLLNGFFSEKNADEWLNLFLEAGLPSGPINSVPEVFEHPQIRDRNLVMEVDHSSAGSIPLTGFPYKLSRTPAELHHPPPMLGENNQEILVKLLGYSEKEVTVFQDNGVI
jgi:CoA:oxalate CoA-transferase